jgi:hypothetical protein
LPAFRQGRSDSPIRNGGATNAVAPPFFIAAASALLVSRFSHRCRGCAAWRQERLLEVCIRA